MDQQLITQIVERLFAGRSTPFSSKNELLGAARSMNLPQSLLGHLGQLPEGQLSKQQVQQHVARAQGTPIERDIEGALGRWAA